MKLDQEKRKYIVLALSFLITFGATGLVMHLMQKEEYQSKIQVPREILAEKTPEMVAEETFHKYVPISEHYADGTKALLPVSEIKRGNNEFDLELLVVVEKKDDWGRRNRQNELLAGFAKWAEFLFTQQKHFKLGQLVVVGEYGWGQTKKSTPALNLKVNRQQWEMNLEDASKVLKAGQIEFFALR